MRKYAAYCYRPSSVVCHLYSEPCKNGSSDRDAVCVEDSAGPKEPLIRYSPALRAEYYIVGIPRNIAI